jgi:hypothetical protein
VEGSTNLLWSNEIYTCVVCGGSTVSPSDKTEAFVFKRKVPDLGFLQDYLNLAIGHLFQNNFFSLKFKMVENFNMADFLHKNS